MRFSLLTLLLASLTAGSLVACWNWSGAWKDTPIATQEFLKQYPSIKYFDWNHLVSMAPDRKRFPIGEPANTTTKLLHDDQNGKIVTLYTFPRYCEFVFMDNDLAFEIPIVDREDFRRAKVLYLWRRRYPEWWWGHFCRPEIWAAVIFGGLLFLSLLRDRARLRRAKVNQ